MTDRSPDFDAGAANEQLAFARLKVLAESSGRTTAKLALGWLLHKAPHVTPIPAMTNVPSPQVDLDGTPAQLSLDTTTVVEALVNLNAVMGPLSNAQAFSEVGAKTFCPSCAASGPTQGRDGAQIDGIRQICASSNQFSAAP